jgi:tight adherence protein B
MTAWLQPHCRTIVGALLAVLALGLWGVSPASAADTAPDTGADTAAIDNAVPEKGAVRLLVSVPGESEVDLAGVEVTVDGDDAESEAVAASQSSVRRTSILAIDTSASMRGTRIAEAKKAALTYLSAVPANVQVGVLTFDDNVNLVVPPSLDRDAAGAAIAGLKLTLETSLYDGVLGALDAVGPGGAKAGQRKILVLSDGKDTTTTSLDEVLEGIESSKAQVNVVSLQRGDEANAPLNAIAKAGKGTMLTTEDPAALTAAFTKEADALARQIVVTAQVPTGSEETSSNVLVTVPTVDETFTASAYVPVRTARDIAAETASRARPASVNAGPLDLSTNVMYGAVGAIAVGLLGMIAIMAMGRGKASASTTLSEQIQAYGVMAVPGQSGPRADAASNAFTGQARQAAERALANNKNMEARIAQSLESAGVALKPAEWLLLRAAILVGGGLFGLLVASSNIIFGVLIVLAALIVPWFYLRRKKKKRLKAFGTGLADTLQLMSGSLSAGLSLSQSVDTIVREGAEPIASEFRRVVIESRLGVTIEDALEGVVQRMDSRDFGWVVMAIRIQREVGGNLAELLLTVAATLREREYLRRHVHALSAEGRLSCYVLGGLPPGFLLYLTVSKPDYVEPIFSTPIGWLMLIGMVTLLGVGILWMSKVSKVDV